MEKYGDALICIRYRYDERRGVRLKTVEIVVDEKTHNPLARADETRRKSSGGCLAKSTQVYDELN